MMTCPHCQDKGVVYFKDPPETLRCSCVLGAMPELVEKSALAERGKKLEAQVKKLEDENARLSRRVWELEQKVFR